MKLYDLLVAVTCVQTKGSHEMKIEHISFDSRQIEKNSLFVAVKGTAVDGHQYIDMAISKGAVAVVCQQMPDSLTDHITYVQVADSADALGGIASAFYNSPSDQLILVGVTGTNGKTTVATLLYDMFRALGHKVGLLSTVCNYVDAVAVAATHTTPDPIELNKLLAQMVDAGCSYAFMEVSSHSIDQKRIKGLSFDGAIFTNLTRDHLDYHGTVEAYLKAKKLFFDQLSDEAFALTNLDDRNGLVMLQNTKAARYTYSLRTLADYKARVIENHFDGMLLQVNQKEVYTRFIGKFNASNLLAVYGASCLLGKDPDQVLTQLSLLKPVSGRFEPIKSAEGFTVVVDYAHTPDALTNVISTINEVLEGSGELITVVGCGGNRDKGKRPIMAQEAVKGSHKVILTSDNPRLEEPDDILADMWRGLDIIQQKKALRIADRKEAIKTACLLAKRGDVVLIAGKGHENYQDIKGVKHHFDDREVVREFISIQE